MNLPRTRGRAGGAPLVAGPGLFAPLEPRESSAVGLPRYSQLFKRLGRYRSLLSSAAELSDNLASPRGWWFSFTGSARMPIFLPCPTCIHKRLKARKTANGSGEPVASP